MKKIPYLGMLIFMLCCNNTDSTIRTHDVDRTDMDDTTPVTRNALDSTQIPLDSFATRQQK